VLFQQISTGSDHCFALTEAGELYSWGLNFKGQLGLGDYDNRYQPDFVSNLAPEGELQKNALVQQLLKQRQEGQELSQTMNLSHQRNQKGSEGGNGQNKSIFNNSYKDLKPSKSVDFSAFNGQTGEGPQKMAAHSDSLAPLLKQKELVI